MTQPYPLYPNIYIKPLQPHHTAYVRKAILPHLEPVIYELAVKHPTWSFDERHSTSIDDVLYVRGFHITDPKGERIGTIDMGRNLGKRSTTTWVFEIYNRRIAQSRERGSSVITGDAKVALKTVKKYFSPPSIAERLETISAFAKSRTYEALVNAREKHNVAHNKIKPAVTAFVKSNWAQVLDSMKDSDRVIAESLPALAAEQESVQELSNQISAKQHLTVLIDGDTYITHDGGTTRSYTTDDLPRSIKINVGLLKLVEEGKPLRDIGIKVSDTTFVLYKGAIDGTDI